MRKALRAHLVAQSLDARVIDEVVLAAEEALNNAIIHAGDVDGMIRVSAWVSESEAAIEVQHRGCGSRDRSAGIDKTARFRGSCSAM
jgi:anti-sigma regulatory factor (Ser/Thr protein kinase)